MLFRNYFLLEGIYNFRHSVIEFAPGALIDKTEESKINTQEIM